MLRFKFGNTCITLLNTFNFVCLQKHATRFKDAQFLAINQSEDYFEYLEQVWAVWQQVPQEDTFEMFYKPYVSI